MKKILALLCALLLTACAKAPVKEADKIKITASLFPQYDFARVIAGDKADVTLLLAPGQESHLYDPSPSDMKSITNSDLFIFTGENMESWAADIASSVGNGVKILDASKGVAFAESGEEDSGSHSHELDPHIWLDFDNVKIMCENICDALVSLSPENEAYFRANLAAYEDEISALDEEYRLVAEASDKTLVFGGKFALGYLTRRYSISYLSAYASCGAEAEPSARVIKELSDYVRENGVKAVYCEEMSDPKAARAIAEGTDAEILVIHSAENTSRDERDAGVSFIGIMRQNLENLRKGLE